MPAGIIIVSGLEVATNADILQGTRLQTVPQGGALTFELAADLSDATNFYTASVQMPSGDTPLNAVRVPANVVAGVIDERLDLQASFAIQQGGHCVFSVIENGTAIFAWRVTYTPQ